MKRIFKNYLLGAAIALALPTSLMARDVDTIVGVREEMARGVAALTADPAFNSALGEHLVNGRASLADVLRDMRSPARADQITHLRNLERQAIELRGLTGALDTLIDVRTYGVDATRPLPAMSDFWIGTISRDPASGEKQVVAFDTAGAEHRYDLESVPSVPMLVVESNGSAALRAGISVMNAELRGDVQPQRRRVRRSAAMSLSTENRPDESLTLLKAIYLTKDHEPNIEGDAEVFAIVSGIGADGKARIITRDMPWLDHDKRWYSPGMDLINWTDYGTNYVNVQLFEEDGNTNFKDLATAVTGATGDLSVLISPEAPAALIVAGVSKIANEILKIMPAKWFENSNDYIDSFYVIERGGNYGSNEEPLRGARGEAFMILEPYVVKHR